MTHIIFNPENGVKRAAAHNRRVAGCERSFYCDDIDATVATLAARGVVFTQEVQDHGYGLVTYFSVPGGFKVQLYQPRHSK